jgi:hypothetical protein
VSGNNWKFWKLRGFFDEFPEIARAGDERTDDRRAGLSMLQGMEMQFSGVRGGQKSCKFQK